VPCPAFAAGAERRIWRNLAQYRDVSAASSIKPPHETGRRRDAVTLLKWALFFFVISIVAALFGFTGISAATADVARLLFYVFVVIFLVLLVLGLTIFRV
jgi:uncharacterized membrane protein YtjA (UPF0391 family)